MGTHRPADRNTLVRRLALTKVRELRRAGMSYREIARRFAPDPRDATTGPHVVRAGGSKQKAESDDRVLLLRVLNALDQGLALYDCTGACLLSNRTLAQVLETGPEGPRLRLEIHRFVGSLCTRAGRQEGEGDVSITDVREVPVDGIRHRLRGIRVPLGPSGQTEGILVVLERPASGFLSDEVLRTRFGLSKQQSRIVRLIIDGCSNAEIASALFLSPHTVRHHTEHIFAKLEVRSRAELVAAVLREASTVQVGKRKMGGSSHAAVGKKR